MYILAILHESLSLSLSLLPSLPPPSSLSLSLSLSLSTHYLIHTVCHFFSTNIQTTDSSLYKNITEYVLFTPIYTCTCTYTLATSPSPSHSRHTCSRVSLSQWTYNLCLDHVANSLVESMNMMRLKVTNNGTDVVQYFFNERHHLQRL